MESISLPCMLSVFNICPLWGRKRSRKHPVKHIAAAVGYSIIVVDMKTEVKREVFLCRIWDITGNYHISKSVLVDISEICIWQITFNLFRQFNGDLKTNLIFPYNGCLGNKQQFYASWKQILSCQCERLYKNELVNIIWYWLFSRWSFLRK